MAVVTIVIPLYNKERQIERAVRSVQRQTFEDWRLIVVDDGSTDNGPQIARSIKDSRIEVVHQKNAGPGAARNTGIRMAQTPYISFLDADDEWTPKFLEVTLDAIRKNDVAMVSTTMLELPQKRDTLDILEDHHILPGIFDFKGNEDPEKIQAIIAIPHQFTVLLKKKVIEKYGGFYTENKCVFGEDMVLLWRIAFSERFMIIGQALAIYHTEDSELGPHTQSRPLEPYLKDPRVLLNYCPREKHNLIKGLIDLLVLRRIINQAQHGNRLQLFFLLIGHPGTCRYTKKYGECLKRLVPGYLFWCKLKDGIRHYLFNKDNVRSEMLKDYYTAKRWRTRGLIPIPVDYPINPEPRWGHGKPSHKGLYDIVNKNREKYIELLRQFMKFNANYKNIPVYQTTKSKEPHWINNYFQGLDPISLYSFLATHKPQNYIEIGSGNSTKFARRAISDFGLETKITSIDPQPRAEIDLICDKVIRRRLEDIDLTEFDILSSGDILFIDGSHRCFTNSDVTVVFLEILPALKSGVLVYIDDIYIPDDYPPEWSNRYYSEQYLLSVLLLSETTRYEILLPCSYIFDDAELGKIEKCLWEGMENARERGNGFWLLVR